MATLYKNRGIWYITTSIGSKRITRSLRTKDKRIAWKLKPAVELELLSQLSGVKQRAKDVPFDELVRLYLEADHNWSKRTKELNDYVFKSYQSGKPLLTNPTSRAIFVRTINTCWNWGMKQGLISKAHKLEGDTKGESRNRVLNDKELKTLLDEIRDNRFNLFVRFAYYSGARSGEIRRISRATVFSNYMIVDGKSGRRIVRLASQARKILDQNPQWDYTVNYVQLTWSRNRNRLGLKDARMHDLRRTFGYNLIKQGRPIYEVSKLLGHSSVTTTERHYAPLMATEIEEFIL